MTIIEWSVSDNATAPIQAALDAGGTVALGPGLFRVHSLLVGSNTRLVLHPATVLQRIPGVLNEQILRLSNVERVTIEGGVIDGNRSEGPGERCHCIGIAGGRDIVIKDIELRNAPQDGETPALGTYGDGLYVGSYGGAPVERLRVSNVYSHDHDRHGIFVVAAKDSSIRDCVLADISGNAPGSALNVEPNDATETIQNLTVRDCVMRNSEHGLTANNHYGGEWSGLLFEGCRFEGNRFIGAAHSGGPSTRDVRFVSCTSTGNGSHGFECAANDGLTLRDCEASDNGAAGVYLYQPRDVTVAGCRLVDNAGCGLFAGVDDGVSVIGNIIAGNTGGGVRLQYSIPFDHTYVSRFMLALNRMGKNPRSGRDQPFGFQPEGERARGARMTRNVDTGHELGLLLEWPQGDAATALCTDVLESQQYGQQGWPKLVVRP